MLLNDKRYAIIAVQLGILKPKNRPGFIFVVYIFFSIPQIL